MRYAVEPMRVEDIDEVAEIEKQCFSVPWPLHAYRRELDDRRNSRYIVARILREGPELPPPSSPPPTGIRHAVSQLLRPLGLTAPSNTSSPPRLAGYAGMWYMLDEAHITTIGVRDEWRGQGIGELLLASLLHLAKDLGADRMTLEVRVSNLAAQALYRKYGFADQGVRRRYYSDNSEDALIMWSEPLGSAPFQGRMEELQQALAARVDGTMLSGDPYRGSAR